MGIHARPRNSMYGRRVRAELVIIFVLMIAVYVLAVYYDIMEKVVEYSRQHERWQVDELLTVFIFLVFALSFFSLRRWRDVIVSERDLAHRNEELQKALSEMKQLKGIIPICSGCKKIRQDTGFWQHVEEYVRDHSDAEFSHGICPDCMKQLYPSLRIQQMKRESPPADIQ